MEKLLTIIIPSYNVEKTLEQTVSSMMISDNELLLLLEILIINDGSTDSTAALAEKLAQRAPGVIRVISKENGGHGSTLNVGVREARGKYLKPVDGDDWLSTPNLEKFMKILKDTNADLVCTDYYRYSELTGEQTYIKISDLPYGKMFNFSEIYKQYTFVFNSLTVKTEKMRHPQRVIDEHCYYSDVQFVVFSAMAVDTIQYIDLPLYVYRIDQATQSVSTAGWIKHYLEHERIIETLIKYYIEYKTSETCTQEKISYCLDRIARSCGGHYLIGLRFDKNNRKEFCSHLRKYNIKLKEINKEIYELSARHPAVKICQIFDCKDWIYELLSVVYRMRRLQVKLIKQ